LSSKEHYITHVHSKASLLLPEQESLLTIEKYFLKLFVWLSMRLWLRLPAHCFVSVCVLVDNECWWSCDR